MKPAHKDEDAKVFSTSFRVYYEDTDAGEVVYYANYLHFAERARTEWLRSLGMTHTAMLAKYGLFFVVRHAEINYLASARLDDLLVAETFLTHIGAASLDMRQILRQKEPADAKRSASCDTILTTVAVTLVAVTSDGKVVRLPKPVRDRLQALVTHDPLDRGDKGKGR